jgi:hypothetical protein
VGVKTSKAQRIEEFKKLDLMASNGRLLTWAEIKRYRKLRAARVNESKTSEKA